MRILGLQIDSNSVVMSPSNYAYFIDSASIDTVLLWLINPLVVMIDAAEA